MRLSSDLHQQTFFVRTSFIWLTDLLVKKFSEFAMKIVKKSPECLACIEKKKSESLVEFRIFSEP